LSELVIEHSSRGKHWFLALVFREPRPTPTPEAWLALGYLLVFGSILAFTSFVTVLQILPTKVVMTYPYVNPVIAMFLGWLLLREPITAWTIGGAGLVLLGVAAAMTGIYWLTKRRQKISQAEDSDKEKTEVMK